MVTHSSLLVDCGKVFADSVPLILVLVVGDICNNFISFSSKAGSRYRGFILLTIVLAELTQSPYGCNSHKTMHPFVFIIISFDYVSHESCVTLSFFK